MFDEAALHEAIIKTWGEHGAHNDVFTAMRDRLRSAQAENKHLRDEIEHLEALLVEANEAFDEVTDTYAQELVAGEEWRTYYDDNLRSTD